MPPNPVLRGWLHILLQVLFLSLSVGTFFNLNPDLNFQGIGPFSSFLRLCDMLIEQWPPEWRPGLDVQETGLRLLYISSIVTLWSVAFYVKRRMYSITQHYIEQAQQFSTKTAMLKNGIKGLKRHIKVLRREVKGQKRKVASTKLLYKQLKDSFKASTAKGLRLETENCDLQANLEKQMQIYVAAIQRLEKKLESTTNQLHEKANALQQKLAQEELLHQEKDDKYLAEIRALKKKITASTTDWQKTKDTYRAQEKENGQYLSRLENSLTKYKLENERLKGSLKASSTASVNSAEEASRFQKTTEQKQRLHQEEIESLKGQLESMTKNMQEMESALKEELDQMEAKVETKSEGILKECQNLLKDMVQLQKQQEKDSYEDMVAYHSKEMALARERSKPADLHSRELAEKEATVESKSKGILKECQYPLENKIQFQNRQEQKAYEDMVAYHSKEMALARERSKPADLHSRLEEPKSKPAVVSPIPQAAQKPQTPSRERDVSTHNGIPPPVTSDPSTQNREAYFQHGHQSKRVVDQHRGRGRRQQDGVWSGFQGHRGYRWQYVPSDH